MITVHDRQFVPFIESETIEKRVFELSQEIEQKYQNTKPLFIVVLNGSFMFAAQLLKNIALECDVEFVKFRSYEGTESTGNVAEVIGLNIPVENRQVIVIEDIVDTGNTLNLFRRQLEQHNPQSLELATLVLKPEAFQYDYPLNFVGFEIPNKFIVGYGMDYDGAGRNLNQIYQITE